MQKIKRLRFVNINENGGTMKHITFLILLCFFTSCALHSDQNRSTASASKYMNEKYFAIINLTNIKIISSEGANTFPYSVSNQVKVDAKTKSLLLEESGDDLVLSEIYSVGKSSSSFKNIFAFITQRINGADSVTFRLNIAFQNKSGSFTLIDYDIYEATTKELKVLNGPKDEEEKLRVFAEKTFFP